MTRNPKQKAMLAAEIPVRSKSPRVRPWLAIVSCLFACAATADPIMPAVDSQRCFYANDGHQFAIPREDAAAIHAQRPDALLKRIRTTDLHPRDSIDRDKVSNLICELGARRYAPALPFIEAVLANEPEWTVSRVADRAFMRRQTLDRSMPALFREDE